jgi:Tfp pilus assembly protein PilF
MKSAPKIRQFAIGSVLALMTSSCITISPTPSKFSVKSLWKGDVQQASHEQKDELIPATPKNPAKLKMAYGQLMEESGHHAEARKNYDAVLALQPKNVDAVLAIARLDEVGGHTEQAEQGYRRAVKLAPNSAQAHFSLGKFLANQRRWTESAESLTKAMLSEPDHVQYRYELAVTLVHCGDVNSAMPHFIRTIGDAEAHYNVGLILQEEGNLAEAERHFAMAVTKKPELTEAQNWLVHLRKNSETTLASAEKDSVVPATPTAPQIVPTAHATTPTSQVFAKPRTGDGTGNAAFFTPQQLEQLSNQSRFPADTPRPSPR